MTKSFCALLGIGALALGSVAFGASGDASEASATPEPVSELVDDWFAAAVTGDGSVTDLYLPTGDHLYGDQHYNSDTDFSAGPTGDGDSGCDRCASGDFNGDGEMDLAIGVPGESINLTVARYDAGAVQVLYGTNGQFLDGTNQLWYQDAPGILGVSESNDRFGSSLTVGDFDGNGTDDLAIGVPGEGIERSGAARAGAVQVLYGTNGQFLDGTNQLWYQDAPGILGGSESNDRFGSSLTVGDFDGNGTDDLAIGVPGESINLTVASYEAGAVQVLYGTNGQFLDGTNQLWYQDAPGILGGSESNDSFGESLPT